MAKGPEMIDNTADFMEMLRNRTVTGLIYAAAAHQELWIKKMEAVAGPSKEGEFPAKDTGKAISSIDIALDVDGLKSASGAEYGFVEYLKILEESMERLGCAYVYQESKEEIAQSAREGLELKE